MSKKKWKLWFLTNFPSDCKLPILMKVEKLRKFDNWVTLRVYQISSEPAGYNLIASGQKMTVLLVHPTSFRKQDLHFEMRWPEGIQHCCFILFSIGHVSVFSNLLFTISPPHRRALIRCAEDDPHNLLDQRDCRWEGLGPKESLLGSPGGEREHKAINCGSAQNMREHLFIKIRTK